MMGDEFKVIVLSDKNSYLPGESVMIRLACDNSKCSKVIKSFKLKLKRKVYINHKSFIGGLAYKSSVYLAKKKV